MTLHEKQELVRLLTIYQEDLIKANDANIEEASKYPGQKWQGNYTTGVKAQYEHARIISAKLSVEIGKGMKSYWDL